MNVGLALAGPEIAPRSPPRARSVNVRVRPLVEDDLDQVADLFLQRFRKLGRTSRARAEIAACMKTLYLDHPSRVGDADALVSLDGEGRVGAFCGGTRIRFLLDGKPLSGCVTGALMASPEPRHAFAAVQILRESRKLNYDFIVTDSANRASLAVCQALNYFPVSPDSLEWTCVFEPASFALQKLKDREAVQGLGVLRPFARALDLAGAAALRRLAPPPKRSDWRDEEADDETYIAAVAALGDGFRLRPDLGRQEFRWLIARARERRSAGPLHLRVLYDPSGAPAGAYAAYGGKGESARVFHCLAAPTAWGRLFDAMRESARERGCIAAHGPLKAPMMAHAYAVRGVVFYYAGGMLVYTKRPDVRSAIERGEALLGGFAGDRWTRLASDSFG
jgi:hypothetical protein